MPSVQELSTSRPVREAGGMYMSSTSEADASQPDGEHAAPGAADGSGVVRGSVVGLRVVEEQRNAATQRARAREVERGRAKAAQGSPCGDE